MKETRKIIKQIKRFLILMKPRIYWGVKLVVPILIYKWKNKGVFLLFTPEHGNLGDHAIAYSEIKLLKKLNISFFEVTGRKLEILDEIGMLGIFNGTTIFVNGGGNLGMLWPCIEDLNRKIISKNMLSKILIFPNTIYYDNTKIGVKDFNKSIEIYNNHPNLYIFAREKLSYNKMVNQYNNVFLVPDMVLSIRYVNDNLKKNGCMICMRSDVEKEISSSNYQQLVEQVRKYFKNNVSFADTVLNENIVVSSRKVKLRQKLDSFCSSELVVTDRLHGMIFAAITGTKCIVINSKSPKLKGCYEWIKDMPHIFWLDDIKNFDDALICLKSVKVSQIKKSLDIQFDYSKLENTILKLSKK